MEITLIYHPTAKLNPTQMERYTQKSLKRFS
jgi:hypothetical protein